MQEALQRRRFTGLIGKGEIDEFVDGVRRFRAEPIQKPAPQPVSFQTRHVEIERLLRRCCFTPCVERFGRCRIDSAQVPLLGQRIPERHAAAMPDGEQIVIVEAEDRAFQQRGERQIVLGQEQRIAERHQIHHGKLLGQLHPVRARDRHALGFQRLHQRPGERVPLAHEDENVAGANGAVLRGQHLAAVDPVPDLLCDFAGQHLRRRSGSGIFRKRLPCAHRVALLRCDDRPDLHEPGLALAISEMAHRRSVGCQSGCVLRVREDQIDGFENRAGRAVGERQRRFDPGLARRACTLGIVAAGFGELARIGALKAIDRLFLVANGKERVSPVVHGLTGEEFGRQCADKGPLRRARILRLVHQNVTQVAVEPEQHPRARARPLEERGGLRDQPVEIHRGALRLGLLVELDNGVSEPEQGGGCRRGVEGAAADFERGEIVAGAAKGFNCAGIDF